jgi:hypothetical protein
VSILGLEQIQNRAFKRGTIEDIDIVWPHIVSDLGGSAISEDESDCSFRGRLQNDHTASTVCVVRSAAYAPNKMTASLNSRRSKAPQNIEDQFSNLVESNLYDIENP